MINVLIRLLGWRAAILQREPLVFDRWRWLRCHLQPGPLRTLDAGCGAGEFTLFAARLGNFAIGLSYDEALNQIGRTRAKLLHLSNARFATMDLRQLDQRADKLGQFDQIVCLETIEHILNDQKLVRDLAAILKPGGRLLLTTPNKHARHSPKQRPSEHEDGGHVRWGYTHAELKFLFETHGLTVITQEYIGGFVSQTLTHWMETDRQLWRYVVWAATLPLRGFILLDPLIGRWLGYPWLSIGVVGIKR